MTTNELQVHLKKALGRRLQSAEIDVDMLSIIVPYQEIRGVAEILHEDFDFAQLSDLSGVDYAMYGEAEWQTNQATSTGFSRGVQRQFTLNVPKDHRFAVVYHLLSLTHNMRVRIKTFVPGDMPRLPSVTAVWSGANWYEREAFDLYGIVFDGHPDLRRILTDYGFVGHPFRKDFPLSGHVEMRYDADKKRVVYEPVDIEPRVLVPRVIRDDSRYAGSDEGASA